MHGKPSPDRKLSSISRQIACDRVSILGIMGKLEFGPLAQLVERETLKSLPLANELTPRINAGFGDFRWSV